MGDVASLHRFQYSGEGGLNLARFRDKFLDKWLIISATFPLRGLNFVTRPPDRFIAGALADRMDRIKTLASSQAPVIV